MVDFPAGSRGYVWFESKMCMAQASFTFWYLLVAFGATCVGYRSLRFSGQQIRKSITKKTTWIAQNRRQTMSRFKVQGGIPQITVSAGRSYTFSSWLSSCWSSWSTSVYRRGDCGHDWDSWDTLFINWQVPCMVVYSGSNNLQAPRNRKQHGSSFKL